MIEHNSTRDAAVLILGWPQHRDEQRIRLVGNAKVPPNFKAQYHRILDFLANDSVYRLDIPPLGERLHATEEKGTTTMETSMNARKDEQHQASEDTYCCMPMHTYDIPYGIKVCMCLAVSAFTILLGLIIPEFMMTLYFWVFVLIELGVLVRWVVWSWIARGKYIYTDPTTGRKYAVRERGDEIIDCYQCSKDWVDIENKAVACINDAGIPDMIPDNTRLSVNCHCFAPEAIKLYVEYSQQCDIRNHLDAAISAAYPGSNIYSTAVPLGNGYVLVDYTITGYYDAGLVS